MDLQPKNTLRKTIARQFQRMPEYINDREEGHPDEDGAARENLAFRKRIDR
ncbi:hypothetical protein NCCP2222_23650 [Sporosarcina sp. NCCP-2222]|nr:hypothetical protein NCCP2222_23650 [Sporosarcina sp. NCCP-2222]